MNHKNNLTIKQFSQQIGYSITTVSRALRGDPIVKAKTIEHIQKQAQIMGYTPNRRALSLKTGQSYNIGLVRSLGSEQNEFVQISLVFYLQDICEAARKKHYSVIMIPSSSDAQECIHHMQKAYKEGQVDGFIISDITPRDKRLCFLEENGIPYASFGRSELSFERPAIDFDDYHVGYEAAKKLISKANDQFCMVLHRKHLSCSFYRLSGIRRALMEHGLQDKEKQLIYFLEDTPIETIIQRAFCRDRDPIRFWFFDHATLLPLTYPIFQQYTSYDQDHFYFCCISTHAISRLITLPHAFYSLDQKNNFAQDLFQLLYDRINNKDNQGDGDHMILPYVYQDHTSINNH